MRPRLNRSGRRDHSPPAPTMGRRPSRGAVLGRGPGPAPREPGREVSDCPLFTPRVCRIPSNRPTVRFETRNRTTLFALCLRRAGVR
jgi:hypothetical protein